MKNKPISIEDLEAAYIDATGGRLRPEMAIAPGAVLNYMARKLNPPLQATFDPNKMYFLSPSGAKVMCELNDENDSKLDR